MLELNKSSRTETWLNLIRPLSKTINLSSIVFICSQTISITLKCSFLSLYYSNNIFAMTSRLSRQPSYSSSFRSCVSNVTSAVIYSSVNSTFENNVSSTVNLGFSGEISNYWCSDSFISTYPTAPSCYTIASYYDILI